MKNAILLVLLVAASTAYGQAVTTDPAFPVADQPVTITVDVTGTALQNFAWDNNTNPVYIWAWLPECSLACDAPTNVNPATDAQSAAKAFRISANKYQIVLTPTTFFNKPAAEISRMGLLLKARDWSGGQTPDYFLDVVNSNQLVLAFTAPTVSPIFRTQGEQLQISANVSRASDLVLKINGATVATAADATTISHTHTVTEGSGTVNVVLSADDGAETVEASFQYIVRSAVVNQPRPAGVIDGINYGADPTRATLCLWAPGKTSVYVRGDFNNWQIQPAYQMKKDGEHFWLEVTGLAAGQEYAFQYLVDEAVWIADPYADKILDPDDRFIPATSYPDLKAFPEAAVSDKWYFNRVAVLQTAQTPYAWQATDYQRPEKDKLVVYELLIRDFFGSNGRTYQNLIDTIGYFKRLGVNAIELMPIMEFNGNDSWGYNPTFLFAPDKYYGPKNKFKEFVDKCHQEGIAVILDIAMNHHDMPNPYVMMDFDFVAGKPAAANKWFNPDAKHPFNVFFDMNHESAYTKKYLDTVNYHWLNEYQVDGFRFDLSKGFTQVNNPNNVDAWSAYDASRIALLKRMADKIWMHSPDAYVILEHLAVNTEETELAAYRAGEGKGMLLWGNMNWAYNQQTIGNAGADIANVYHANRSWTVPHLVGYMESHDEERLMVRNLASGKSSGSYNVKDLATGLDRVKAASLLFYTIPGPKMLWQFGELGYDKSINYCADGTISDGCRVSAKPVLWEYQDVPARASLFDHTAELIHLRHAYDVFTEGTATFTGGTTLLKQVTLKNSPYTATPVNTGEMNAQVAVNFDVTAKTINVAFPHTGTWYDYYDDGKAVSVTGATLPVLLQPGVYKLYTDVAVKDVPPVTGIEYSRDSRVVIYPNPTTGRFTIKLEEAALRSVLVVDMCGGEHNVKVEDNEIDITRLPPGFYVLKLRDAKGSVVVKKLVKQ